MGQKELRAAILAIKGDESLDAETKAKKIRAIMSASHRLPPVAAAPSTLTTSVELELDKTVTYHKEGVLGCQHYARKCKLLAACCKQLFTCRVCHDEAVDDHKIDRHATEQVFCMSCSTLQPVGEVCERCNTSFARYFCHVCKFFDDTPDKEIYHCKDCGICRIGSTQTTFHCIPCGACMRVELKDHKHIDRSLHSDCPICNENLFTSRDSVHYLPCAHSIHWKCFDLLYRQGGYGCPICKKSISNFAAVWRRFDRVLAARPMPEIFKNSKVLTLCNDCDAKTESPFHYLGARCQTCGSYNTAVTGRLNFPTQEEIIAYDAAERARQAQNPDEPIPADPFDLDMEIDEDEFDEDAEIDLDQEWDRQQGPQESSDSAEESSDSHSHSE